MTFYSEEYSLTEAQIFASELGIFLSKLNNRIKGDVGKSYSYKKLSGSSVEKIIEEAKRIRLNPIFCRTLCVLDFVMRKYFLTEWKKHNLLTE